MLFHFGTDVLNSYYCIKLERPRGIVQHSPHSPTFCLLSFLWQCNFFQELRGLAGQSGACIMCLDCCISPEKYTNRLEVARQVGATMSKKCAMSKEDLPGRLRQKFEEFCHQILSSELCTFFGSNLPTTDCYSCSDMVLDTDLRNSSCFRLLTPNSSLFSLQNSPPYLLL